MGTLACMLKERGHRVTGSDANIYPPMSGILAGAGIPVLEGFREENVDGAELAVIGNAVSRGNPEAERVLNRRIPYLSMAGALARFFLSDRDVIAVAGTHGKTTTTALLSHILVTAGEDPSFFVGGVSANYGASHRLGKGRHFVIEGDEYDSAFFEKTPKFVFYRPRHLVLTSLEFDHADIYRDLEDIEIWFRRLVQMVPSEGHVVYSREYANLAAIAERSRSRLNSFGAGESPFGWALAGHCDESAALDLVHPGGTARVDSPLFGDYNYMNVTAAAAMASLLGVPWDAIAAGIGSFRGVRRRMELIHDGGRVKVFEDFAHHPTAIAGAIRNLRARFPERVLWAVYEPRSATARRNVFENSLPGAFAAADRILLKEPYRPEAIAPEERLDIEETARRIDSLKGNSGSAAVFANADMIVGEIAQNLDPGKEHVIVIMSNGGFEGIYDKMKAALRDMPN